MNSQNIDELSYIYLIPAELETIHDEIISATGGHNGINAGLVDLCAYIPQSNVYGYEPYKTLLEKAAALMCNINKLHPFVDGNKRTAYTATGMFLEYNGHTIAANKEEAIKISLDIAKCNRDVENITSWLEKHVQEVPADEI